MTLSSNLEMVLLYLWRRRNMPGAPGADGADGIDASAPAGGVLMYAGATVPTGYLECDGASVLRADYPALFAAIGVVWGSVDGTHFNVPDMRGRAPIGVGSGSGLTTRALADSGGAETHQLSLAEMPSHNHSITGRQSASGNDGNLKAVATLNTADVSWTIGATGSSNSHNNMQPYNALKFIIKT